MPHHSPPTGAPCWFELASTDPGASLAFHRALFGWDAEAQDMGELGTYTFLRNGTGTIGALCGLPPGAGDGPSAWNVYFKVADADASTARAQQLGGRLLGEPFDVPGHGRGAALADPGGAAFCVWQSAGEDSGDFTMFEEGAVGWAELATRDSAAARRFYEKLLGWKFKASSAPVPGDEPYLEYAVGDTQYGGLLAMTKEWGDAPPHWAIYVQVADVDACLARASQLGGKVCVPAFDVEGVGRIGRVDDPTGAGLYVIRLKTPG